MSAADAASGDAPVARGGRDGADPCVAPSQATHTRRKTMRKTAARTIHAGMVAALAVATIGLHQNATAPEAAAVSMSVYNRSDSARYLLVRDEDRQWLIPVGATWGNLMGNPPRAVYVPSGCDVVWNKYGPGIWTYTSTGWHSVPWGNAEAKVKGCPAG